LGIVKIMLDILLLCILFLFYIFYISYIAVFFLLGENKKRSVAWKEDISERSQVQRKLRKTIEI
jgi:hypothetical protein